VIRQQAFDETRRFLLTAHVESRLIFGHVDLTSLWYVNADEIPVVSCQTGGITEMLQIGETLFGLCII